MGMKIGFKTIVMSMAICFAAVAPSRAAPRFAPAVRAAGVYPRFLGHARRHFWRGRWLWVGVPLAAYAYDPCWTRIWTDWGWGWFYACGYDPAYGY